VRSGHASYGYTTKRQYIPALSGTANPYTAESWIQGATVGLDWKNVQISSGLVCGTNHNPNASGGPYDDSGALFPGIWNADQEMIGTVFTQNQDSQSGHNQEVELRLRCAVSANSFTGYECLWRCTTSGQYCQLVSWDGVIGSFTLLATAGSPPAMSTGHQVRATVRGTVVKMFHRTSQTVAWTENISHDTAGDTLKYSTGRPGVGFWNRQTGADANVNFGFTYLVAREL
jgi:hypothetical protein